MTRKLNAQEKDALRNLPIMLPEYDGSHPFSKGAAPLLYREDELRKKAEKKSDRTDWFEKRLFAIWCALGEPVPYAFRVDGAIRSLDAGCLGHLFNKSKPELLVTKDSDGYIIAVEPVGAFAERYVQIEERLRREIRPDVGVTAGTAAIPVVGKSLLHSSESFGDTARLSQDLDEIFNQNLSETERKQLIDARVGQGVFRRNVLALWDNRCALTGCDLAAVIRASHIVPWSEATSEERLDRNNGLPLVATIDALFDAGLISFDDTGAVLFAERLDAEHRELVSGREALLRPLSPEMKSYLARHRQTHGFVLKRTS